MGILTTAYPGRVDSRLHPGSDPSGRDDAGAGAYFHHERGEVLDLVPADATRILEVGCAAGATGAALKRRSACRVVGIEKDELAGAEAAGVLDEVLTGDVELMELPFEPGSFDAIVCTDVIEHLVDPAATIRRLVELLVPGGSLVVGVPNIAHLGVIAGLAEGRFDYVDAGILDRTHLSTFTVHRLVSMLAAAGLELDQMVTLHDQELPGQLTDPATRTANLVVGRVSLWDVPVDEAVRLHASQFVVRARPTGRPSEAPSPPEATVAVVTGDEATEVLALLERLGAVDPGASYELVIVDEASTDATAQLASSSDGFVKVIHNPEPKGTVGACRQVIEVSRTGALVLLDTGFAPSGGWLAALLGELESVGLTSRRSPVVVDPTGRVLMGGAVEDAGQLVGLVPDDALNVLVMGDVQSVGSIAALMSERSRCRVTRVAVCRSGGEGGEAKAEGLFLVDPRSDLDALGIAAGCFDAVVCDGFLERVADPWSAIGVIASWMAAGSSFVARVANAGALRVLAGLAEGRFELGAPETGRMRFFTRAGFVAMLRAAGIEITEVDGVTDTGMEVDPELLPDDALTSVTAGRVAINGVPKVQLRDLASTEFLVRGTRSRLASPQASEAGEGSGVTGADPGYSAPEALFASRPLDATIVLDARDEAAEVIAFVQSLVAVPAGALFELLIVDWGSVDGLGALRASADGNVRVIHAGRALTRSGARNLVARQARGRHLVFCEPNLSVTAGWLGEMVARLESESRMAVVAPRLVDAAGSELAGGTLTGSALAVRSDAFDLVGGFDESFVGDDEVTDLCLRLADVGWQVSSDQAGVLVQRRPPKPPLVHRRKVSARRLAERWGERAGGPLAERG